MVTERYRVITAFLNAEMITLTILGTWLKTVATMQKLEAGRCLQHSIKKSVSRPQMQGALIRSMVKLPIVKTAKGDIQP